MLNMKNPKRKRRILFCLPLIAWVLISGWMSGFEGVAPLLLVGHWLLIPLIGFYLAWLPLVAWITQDGSPPRNDGSPPRRSS